MKRFGRTKPYTEQGIKRTACARCGAKASQQWCACADGVWRPICTNCDVELNRMVLEFMHDPDVDLKMHKYEESLNV